MSNEDLKFWSLVEDNYCPKNVIKECECSISQLHNKIDDLNRKVRFLEEQNERAYSLLLNIENRLRTKEAVELNKHLRNYGARKIEPIGFIPEPKPPLSSLFKK